MQTKIVKLSEIIKHPTSRMDAAYWIGKEQGKKAYNKSTGGTLVENDNNGKIMLREEDAANYNDLKQQETLLQDKIKSFNL